MNPINLDVLSFVAKHPVLRSLTLPELGGDEYPHLPGNIAAVIVTPTNTLPTCSVILSTLGDTLLNVSGVRGIEATFSLSRALELGHKAVNRGAVVEREALLLGNQKDIDRH